MKRLNKNMNGDDENFYSLPQNKELSAQYLLLYEMSLPYGLDLTDRINIDKSSSRLSFSFKNISSVEMRDFAQRAENWQKENLPEYMFSKATGPNILFNYISQRNIESMIWGTIISTITTCLLIAFLFKNWRIGIISLIPNITPILVSMGIWGLLVGQVNMAVAFISSITFGIIVDDTIHMLSKFYHAKNKLKYSVEESIVYAFKISGEAIFVTTVILVVGFSILGLSHFAPNKFTGILSAIVISVALFFDLFGLPALLNLIYRKKTK
jgi:predicted RND superfamily exporter protein